MALREEGPENRNAKTDPGREGELVKDILIGVACAWTGGFVVIMILSIRKYRRRRRAEKALMIDHIRRVTEENSCNY